MIPLRDAIPSRTFPLVTYAIIAVNAFAFFIEISQGRGFDQLIHRFGIVPSRFLRAGIFDLPQLLTLLSSMFLHGGWLHILGNMWFLHIFGDNIEDRLGHIKYLFFYLLSGIGAAFTQVALNPASGVPMVGASGAIAGVMGAYVFLYPRARIVTLIPIIVFLQVIELPAFVFLGLWFVLQIFSGLTSLGIGADAGGVAWWAHIGGFAAGALLLVVLGRRR
jgi:membrane associated rhomboid family serine protease